MTRAPFYCEIRRQHPSATKSCNMEGVKQRQEVPSNSSLRDTAAEAFNLVLHHPAVAADHRIICKLLQVSKASRSTVLQTAAGITQVAVDADLPETGLSQVSSQVSNWLVDNRALVKNLDLYYSVDSTNYDTFGVRVASRFEGSLEGAALRKGINLSTAWRLETFSTDLPVSNALLAMLPAATLTRLSLSTMSDGTNLSSIGALSNLRHLLLTSYEDAGVPQSCFQATSSLRKLTRLDVSSWPSAPDIGNDLHHLPAQLSELVLDCSTVLVSLQHITGLRCLEINCETVANGCSLPASLQELSLVCQEDTDCDYCVLEALGVSIVTGLTSLVFNATAHKSRVLQTLGKLPHLHHVELDLAGCADDLVAAAASWQHLPQLHDLVSSVWGNDTDQTNSQELHQLLQHIAAATQLTRLSLGGESDIDIYI